MTSASAASQATAGPTNYNEPVELATTYRDGSRLYRQSRNAEAGSMSAPRCNFPGDSDRNNHCLHAIIAVGTVSL